MATKTDLGIPSLLIIYTFINLYWYLLFSNYFTEIANISYLQWGGMAISLLLFTRYSESSFGRNFSELMGELPKLQDVKELLIISVFVYLTGIGGAALLIFIESQISPNFVAGKWHFITPELFASIQWNPYWIVIYSLSASILVPITEELFNRGLLFGRLQRKYNPAQAVLLSACIFALFHINKSYIGSFIHGLIYVLLLIEFSSLYYPIIIHGIYNGLSVISQQYFGVMSVIDIEKIIYVGYWWPELVMLLTGILLGMYYFYERLNKGTGRLKAFLNFE